MKTYFHCSRHRQILDYTDNGPTGIDHCPSNHSGNSVSYLQQRQHKTLSPVHHHHHCTMTKTNGQAPCIVLLLGLQTAAVHWVSTIGKY